MQPLIIFSYGMTKCGTTLAFQLARAVLEACGCDQPRLSAAALGTDRKINFAQHITGDMAGLIVSATRKIGHPIVIKSHTSLDPAVRRLFADGQATGHAIFRDPRDMALSLLDAGRAARKAGSAAFSEITDLNAALKAVRDQTAKLAEWLALPGILPLNYDDIAFDTAAVARLMLDHMGLQGDPASIAAKARSDRFTQLNKGLRDRHKTEMSPEDAEGIAREFAPFIDLLIRSRPQAPLPAGQKLTSPDLAHVAQPLAGAA